MTRITRATLAEAAAELGQIDPDFVRLIDAHGLPGLRSRPTGFGTLLKVIAAQQVSTTSSTLCLDVADRSGVPPVVQYRHCRAGVFQ